MIKLDVLDLGFIELEALMGGDRVVARAARICYQSESTSTEADKKLIRRLLLSKPSHNTVFEHAVFRWHVKCPIFVARQWMRHRIGTFNEKSLRYCKANADYYVPEYDIDNPLKTERYERGMEEALCAYHELLELGMKREQARGVLGTALYTEFIWTVNAWSFMNWLTKRLDNAAQSEHRAYAKAALDIFAQVMPVTAAAFLEEYVND